MKQELQREGGFKSIITATLNFTDLVLSRDGVEYRQLDGTNSVQNVAKIPQEYQQVTHTHIYNISDRQLAVDTILHGAHEIQTCYISI